MNQQLTTREMLMLDEAIRLSRTMTKFAHSCAQQVNDPQLRALCQQIAVDHNNDLQALSRYTGNRNY
ncbi:MAG: hypothetical protein HPY50_09180 [Firmicutes bacterium]|nr:hypothetical protein [Bacillota bacterium]